MNNRNKQPSFTGWVIYVGYIIAMHEGSISALAAVKHIKYGHR